MTARTRRRTRSFALGLVPYVAMIMGIGVFNSGRVVLGMPLLLLWITVCLLATPPFLWLAMRALPEDER